VLNFVPFTSVVPPKPSLPAKLLQPFLSQEPAAQLIRQTARQQWRLIAVNMVSSMVEAFSEAVTLGLVFLAVQVLSAPAATPFNWAIYPLLGWWPAAAAWLNGLPATAQFLSILGLALLVQALQSFTKFLNQLSEGYFAAGCRAVVPARIHRQVLSLNFPCASSYKVGEITGYTSQGPEASTPRSSRVVPGWCGCC
jgi:ATP-binding cassette subfamily B protein/subfamily B ATP-binding cassette protein MsbA